MLIIWIIYRKIERKNITQFLDSDKQCLMMLPMIDFQHVNLIELWLLIVSGRLICFRGKT